MHDKEYGVVEQYTKRNKNRSIWQRFVRMLACVVVFCTTYALILPVITMEQNYFCGMEDHTHGEACYGYSQSAEETCSAKLLGVHTHVGGCYDEAGNNLCGYSDKLIHTHDAQCYDTEGNLWCLLAEVEEHAHTDACYTTTADVLICQVEETEGHAHGDGCYDDEGALVCTLEEQEGHTHAESCYEPGQQAVVCGNSEYVPHTHTDDCKEGNVLICGVQEVLVHQHTEACVPNLEKVLTCQLPEHIHTNVCSIDPNAETEEPHVTEPTQEVTEAPTEGETEGETQVPTEGETQEPTEGETEEGTEAPTEGETEGETEEATTEPIMMMAAGPKDYTLKTMNPDKLEKGQSYVIYYKNGNNCYILNANANKPGVTTVDVGNTNTPTTVDGTWTLKTSNLNNITWTVEQGTTNNGMWLLANAYDDEGYAGGEYLCLNGSTVQTWNNTGKINFELRNVNGAGAQLYSTQENRYLNFYRNAWSGNNNSGVQIYFALPVAAEDNDASDEIGRAHV